MEENQKNKNPLGVESIESLLRKFSVPAVITLLVNALYNIVDQVFIGWGVGYLGNGATNIVYPLIIIALAFNLLYGDGAGAYLSIKLGQNSKEEGAKGARK